MDATETTKVQPADKEPPKTKEYILRARRKYQCKRHQIDPEFARKSTLATKRSLEKKLAADPEYKEMYVEKLRQWKQASLDRAKERQAIDILSTHDVLDIIQSCPLSSNMDIQERTKLSHLIVQYLQAPVSINGDQMARIHALRLVGKTIRNPIAIVVAVLLILQMSGIRLNDINVKDIPIPVALAAGTKRPVILKIIKMLMSLESHV